jgi:hypothetical protein
MFVFMLIYCNSLGKLHESALSKIKIKNIMPIARSEWKINCTQFLLLFSSLFIYSNVLSKIEIH